VKEKKYITCADTAKLLRVALKAQFPATKFSVRSHTYSGGASIDVSWVDGPFISDVDKIAKRYQGATFDGSIDLKEYHDGLVYFEGDNEPTLVHFGADFVFTNRDLSPAYIEQLSIEAQKVLNDNAHTSGRVFAYDEKMTFSGEYLATPFGVMDYPHAYGSNIVRWLSHHIPAGQKVGA
jgi:Large polyvalent protein associated domain 29